MTATIDIDAPPAPEDDARQTRRTVDRLRATILTTGGVVLAALVATVAVVLVTRPQPTALEQAQAACDAGMIDPDGALILAVVRSGAFDLTPVPSRSSLVDTVSCLARQLEMPEPRSIGDALLVVFRDGTPTTLRWPNHVLRIEPDGENRAVLRFAIPGL